jgi:hypothetical protein
MVEEKRDAVESVSSYLDGSRIADAQRLNGSKRRMRFEDVRLPSWLQNGATATETQGKGGKSFQGNF